MLLNILHCTGWPPQITQSKMSRVQLLKLLHNEKDTGFEMETPGLKSRQSLHLSEPISPFIKRDPDFSEYSGCARSFFGSHYCM